MIFSLGGILYPSAARIPANGIASNGTCENTSPNDFEKSIKPLPEKSPILTKNVSTITVDLYLSVLFK